MTTVAVPYESVAQYQDIVDWLRHNVGAVDDGPHDIDALLSFLSQGQGWRVAHRTLNDELVVVFDHEQDAMLFLLRWS